MLKICILINFKIKNSENSDRQISEDNRFKISKQFLTKLITNNTNFNSYEVITIIYFVTDMCSKFVN